MHPSCVGCSPSTCPLVFEWEEGPFQATPTRRFVCFFFSTLALLNDKDGVAPLRRKSSKKTNQRKKQPLTRAHRTAPPGSWTFAPTDRLPPEAGAAQRHLLRRPGHREVPHRAAPGRSLRHGPKRGVTGYSARWLPWVFCFVSCFFSVSSFFFPFFFGWGGAILDVP